MKEEKFKLESFIGGWYISKSICKSLIHFFEKNKHRQSEGFIGNDRIDKNGKESIDISLNTFDSALDEYNGALQKCLELYNKKYPETEKLYSKYVNHIEKINIQRYLPNQGFKVWHCERAGIGSTSRCLVFMTYLNDVKNGGTEFKYQNLKTEAKEGLTLIWPSDFTHVHRGIIANEIKYVITGWYNFTEL
jgi:prolyl 4-hydroxylase